MKKLSSGIVLALLLAGTLTVTYSVRIAKSDYVATGPICILADGSISPPTAPIQRNGNTYTLTGNITTNTTAITVQNDAAFIDGAGYALRGSTSGYACGFNLTDVGLVTIRNTRIANFHVGILLGTSSCNNIINGNHIRNNTIGIYPSGSCNNNVSDNDITSNDFFGIISYSSENNRIVGNNITNNSYGIYLYAHSHNNIISGNNVTASSMYGIWLDSFSNCNNVSRNKIANNTDGVYLTSSNNSISENKITANTEIGISFRASAYNTVRGNNITNNAIGIGFPEDLGDPSSGNAIYHNNFINNTCQVNSASPINVNGWNRGLPSGGNYWSGYSGVDLYSGPYQNETGSDGIGDTLNTIDFSNVDLYPLMGEFHQFSSFYGKEVSIVSNSSVSNFNCSPVGSTAALTFNVTGKYGTHGFCQVCIPKALINGSFIVTFDGKPVGEEYARTLSASIEDYTYIYINYTHCKHTIEITGTPIILEFSAFLILPLLLMATLLAVIIYKKKSLASLER